METIPYNTSKKLKNHKVKSHPPKLLSFLCNLLQHYDTSLYGLLIPFLAPFLFPHAESLKALIYGYMLLPLGYIAKPLGALYFGHLADKQGTLRAFRVSTALSALATLSMGLCPSYACVGLWSPVILVSLRLLQSFFSAAQTVSGAKVALHSTHSSKKLLIAGLFDASAIGGMLIASLSVGLLAINGKLESLWRVLFLLAAAPFTLSYFLSSKTEQSDQQVLIEPFTIHLKKHILLFFALISAAGFTHLTYQIAFVFFCGFIPHCTSFSSAELILSNSYLLIIDMVSLPLFAHLAQKVGKNILMKTSVVLFLVCLYPLFYLISKGLFIHLVLARILFVLLGVAFASCFWVWVFEITPEAHQGKFISLGTTLGACLLASPSSAIAVWLYKTTQNPIGPIFYFAFVGLLTLYGLKISSRKKQTVLL